MRLARVRSACFLDEIRNTNDEIRVSFRGLSAEGVDISRVFDWVFQACFAEALEAESAGIASAAASAGLVGVIATVRQ